jgi:hypothetical protein
MNSLPNKILLATVLICITYFLVHQRNRYISMFDSPESNRYVYTANFIKKISSFADNRVRLVVLNKKEKLNSNPEISKMMGFLGDEAYIFPFLNSLNGGDFDIISQSEYCILKKNRDTGYLFIISPIVMTNADNECPKTYLKTLYSGYGLDANELIIDKIFEAFPLEDVLSSKYRDIDVLVEDLFSHDSNVKILVRDWGSKKQILILSKYKNTSLKLRSENTKFSKLIFSESPSRSERHALAFINQRTKIVLTNEFEQKIYEKPFGGVYLAPVGLIEMNINFGASDYSNHFGAYLFVMHEPKLRVLKLMEN